MKQLRKWLRRNKIEYVNHIKKDRFVEIYLFGKWIIVRRCAAWGPKESERHISWGYKGYKTFQAMCVYEFIRIIKNRNN